MSPLWRLRLISFVFLISALLLIARLFYWQILARDQLTALAQAQQLSTLELPAKRGEIITADGSFLVANQPAYFAYLIRDSDLRLPQDLAKDLALIVYNSITYSATPSSQLSFLQKQTLINQAQEIITQRFSDERLILIPLARKLTQDQKLELEALDLNQIIFEEEQSRFYPEASMAAHLVGFVGQNSKGKDLGYHGLEGFYQQELAGRGGIIRQEKDAFNQPIVIGSFLEQDKKDGRKLKLHLNRSLQYSVETKLKKAIRQFGAKSGSVTIIDPFTGAVLAMASLPAYDPQEYFLYQSDLFKNPVVSDAFEPGSIFKVFTMAAALEEEAVKLDTICDICDQPLKIDKYTINTWNDEYFPDSNMTDIIVRSDNVGMVFVGQKLGLNKFLEFYHKFGFSQKTNIDLQDEIVLEAKPDKNWTYVDLATASFGQGFVTTGMQLLQAVSVIANGGDLVQPQIVDKVIGLNRDIDIPTKVKRQVISKATAQKVTAMMVAAAKEGEAKWTATPGYNIAGKTGTAQIAVGGKYEEEKTNASFIGFAPADNPKFAMLVTLKESSTSPWASETAAPLWFSIAQDLLNHFNIVPEKLAD